MIGGNGGEDPPPAGGDPASNLEDTSGSVRDRLTDLGLKVVAAAVSVAGVAVIGQAVAWVRFDAAELPAYQAITVLGQAERVSIGAVALTGFLVAGLIAVAVTFVLDRQAQPSNPATRRGLALVVALGVIAGAYLLMGDSAWFWYSVVCVVIAFVTGYFAAKGQSESVAIRRTAIVTLILAAVLAVPWIEDSDVGWAPLLSLAVGASLGWLCLGIAKQTGTVFRWYGVAVFLSVVLFGAAISAARTFDTPKVQPVAALVESSTGVERVRGIYIADNDDRLYIGRVRLDADGDAIANTGAIYWVPCARVVTYSVGPLQGPGAAVERAKAMSKNLETRAAAAGPKHGRKHATKRKEPTDTETELLGACKP